MPTFSQDFWTYCQTYEIPRSYALWTSIALLGAAINRRVFIRRGDLYHHCNLYLCLVGVQGNKKTTCNDWARDWFTEIYDDIPIASSVQSREDIIKYMASDECTRTYIDHTNTQIMYQPYMMFINELRNFLSFNPDGMVSFLTDIYDRKVFDSRTIVRGAEAIINPAINIIACCTPDWLADQLRGHTATGGLCRRMIFLYSPAARDEHGHRLKRSWPELGPEALAAKKRALEHLRKLKPIAGVCHLDPVARAYFDLWYSQTKDREEAETDPIIAGFMNSMDVQLLKISMLIAIGQEQPTFTITRQHLEEGVSLLEEVLPNMAKLSIAAGRNPLAHPQSKLLEFINSQGGLLPEKLVRRKMDDDFAPREIEDTIKTLKRSGRLTEISIPIPGTANTRMMLATEQYIRNVKQKNEIETKKKQL